MHEPTIEPGFYWVHCRSPDDGQWRWTVAEYHPVLGWSHPRGIPGIRDWIPPQYVVHPNRLQEPEHG